MNKEEFNKLAKKHLFALISYKADENGNSKLEVFGIDKLYEAINFTDSYTMFIGKPKIDFEYWLNNFEVEYKDGVRYFIVKDDLVLLKDMVKIYEDNTKP